MNNRKYYIAQNGRLVEVNQDVRNSINSLTNACRYRATKRKACIVNSRRKAAYCESDCSVCRYYVSNTYSLDDMGTRLDGQIADNRSINTEITYRCIEILADMARIDPDGERIGYWIMHDYTAKEIAAALGIPVSTYYYRLYRIRRYLKED